MPISIKPKAAINSNLQRQTKNENDPRSIIEQAQDKASIPSTKKLSEAKKSENTKSESPQSSFKNLNTQPNRAQLPHPQIQINKKISILGDASASARENNTSKLSKRAYQSKNQIRMTDIMAGSASPSNKQNPQRTKFIPAIVLPKVADEEGLYTARPIDQAVNRLKGK